MKSIRCASLDGLDAIEVCVECSFTKGLPSFAIVGLANSAIQESKDRIKAALLNNDFKFPPKRITINLSPSDLAKQGSHFDLSIALSIALYESKVDFESFMIFGELGLNGDIKDTKALFALVLSLVEQRLIKDVLIPSESYEKVSKIPNLNIYCVSTLNEACEFFLAKDKSQYKRKTLTYEYEKVSIDQSHYYLQRSYELNFNDVKGQQQAKRAALIAAAGHHNILFDGSAGSGKSMIAKRLRYIMPPMSIDQILYKAKLESLDSMSFNFSPTVTFRSPHHSATKASIFGGGSFQARIGEVALSHNGILFFDELPHFSLQVLEALREPLEDHKILISRVNSKVLYPTQFLFVAAMNPCPCGNLLSQTKSCRCSDIQIKKYRSKLSEPFCDRIDLFVTMNDASFDDVADIDSKSLHELVLKAFIMQKRRGQEVLNGKMSDEMIKQYCTLDEPSNRLLTQAIVNFSLSFRAINKVLKLSRTIADIQGCETINEKHLLEALSFRQR